MPKWCWILFAYTTFASKWNHLVDPLLSQLCNELGWGFSISLRIFFLSCWTEKNIQTKRTPLRLVLPCYRTQTFMLIGLNRSNSTPTGIKKKVEFLARYASVPLGSISLCSTTWSTPPLPHSPWLFYHNFHALEIKMPGMPQVGFHSLTKASSGFSTQNKNYKFEKYFGLFIFVSKLSHRMQKRVLKTKSWNNLELPCRESNQGSGV